LYDSSSSSSSSLAAAASHQVIYVDNAASERRVRGPLPDLINVHKPPASLTYDRQPPNTSVIYHAAPAAVNHCMPQPHVSSDLRSPTCRFIRGKIHSVTVMAGKNLDFWLKKVFFTFFSFFKDLKGFKRFF